MFRFDSKQQNSIKQLSAIKNKLKKKKKKVGQSWRRKVLEIHLVPEAQIAL